MKFRNQKNEEESPQIGDINDISAYLVSHEMEADKDDSDYCDQNDRKNSKKVKKYNKAVKKSIGNRHQDRTLGRWKVDQHFYYILAIYQCNTLDQLLKFLLLKLPYRNVCQIKAHHQKMINKHGGFQQIRRSYPDPHQSFDLLGVCKKLETALHKITDLNSQIEQQNRMLFGDTQQ